MPVPTERCIVITNMHPETKRKSRLHELISSRGFRFGNLGLYQVEGTRATIDQMGSILRKVKRGWRNSEIAEFVGVGTPTIKRRLSAISKHGEVPVINCRCGKPRDHGGMCQAHGARPRRKLIGGLNGLMTPHQFAEFNRQRKEGTQ